MLSTEAQCVDCPLYAGATKQLLEGNGPKNARIMLVGEAPGAQEDRAGVPFVGEAGQKLDSMLTRAGLNRADVYVTNAVRCRPPGNRKPTAKEIAACKPHLVREIDEVKPELIITLGNESLKSVTGLSGIKKYRGTTQSMHKSMGEHKCRIVPAFHPSFAVRFPENEPTIVQDFGTANRQLNGGFSSIQVPWVLASSDHGFVRPDFNAPLWSWDIETNARELHDPELEVRFAAIDDGDKIVVFRTPGELADYAYGLSARIQMNLPVVGHNASAFDRMVLKEKYGVNVKTHDTQLLAHLVDENQSLKLQDLCIRYLGVEPWKDTFDVAFWERGPQTEEEWTNAITYCARDTRYTYALFVELWNQSTDREKQLYLQHNVPCSRALAAMERRGVYLSVPNIQESIAQIEVDQRIALLRIKEATNPEFNPASHQQVREVLFSDMLLPLQKKTKGQEASTDEETLKKLQALNLGGSLLTDILDYRKNSKLLGTYLRPYLELAQTSLTPPYMYPSYSMTSTATGRTSSFDPNLQNVPRDPRVRRAAAAPPGYKLLEADYSQVEMRFAAEFAGRQSALFQEYLKPNPDVHLTMASHLTHKPPEQVTKEERARAKPANFASLYQLFNIASRLGIESWKTYQRIALTDYDMHVTEQESRDVQRAFAQWGLDPWYERRAQEIYETGQITTLFGRTRRLPAIRSKDNYAKLEALRQGLNFDDQSTAGDFALLALAEITGQGYHVIGYIHDSILVYVSQDDDALREAAAAIKYAMEVTTPQLVEELFGYRFQVPIVADVKILDSWGA